MLDHTVSADLMPDGTFEISGRLTPQEADILQMMLVQNPGQSARLEVLRIFIPEHLKPLVGEVVAADYSTSSYDFMPRIEIRLRCRRAGPVQQSVSLPAYVHNPNFQDNDTYPEEDTIMGINAAAGKRGAKFPEKIKDLDYSTLHNSQMWVLADFVGCRRQLNSVAGAGKRADMERVLKTGCEALPERAQFGYEIIVLQKEPNKEGSAVDKATEAHYIELLCEILNKYSEGLEQSSKTAVDKILVGVEKHLEGVRANLKDFAKQAIIEAAEKRAPIIIREGDKTRKVKGVLPPEFKLMVELASARIPILLVGPSGCGKTYLAEKLAEALDMECSSQSCSEGMSESVFNGRLLPIGANGAFKHVATPFMQRYETGGVMLLDEVDAGDPNLFTYINKAIANSSYTVEQRHTNPVVTKHTDFVLIAAANTYGNGADAMYVGRNQLDAATLDRFRVGLLSLDYNREVEESLAPKAVCDWAWAIREKIRAQKLRRIMSTRVIRDIGVMVNRYKWDRPMWDKVYFNGWTEAERKLVA